MKPADRKNTADDRRKSGAKSNPGNALLLEKYERLAQARLQQPLTRLFFDLTGLQLHVAWAPPPPLSWESVLPFCLTRNCKRICGSAEAKVQCQGFEKECLARVLRSGTRGYEFTCPFRLRSFWLPVVLGDQNLGIVFIQAPARLSARGASARRSTGSEADLAEQRRSVSARHRFRLAKGLLQLVAHDMAHSALAGACGDHVERLSRNVAAHEKLEAGLRQALHKALPFVAVNPAALASESHAEKIVHRMLDYIHQGWNQPIGLEAFAKQAGMSLAYLSSLFSRTVGFPFRTYLKQLRLEKAQALLNDPLRRISEIAYAVGYTDPNRFRLDFKEHTSLSPSAWREALTA